ncbi:transposase [Sphingopyxis panaciterrulae]|uniref:Transposase n=1 Tax=Sphingopyxis panaciterrulae TaxID=462372 RepID=A0A7W9B9D7_9SPHN|nr:transposase [Sphingopyxis panaciterrulae]
MEKIATIGLDIAKSVFQVHGVDAAGEVVVRKRLSRARVIPFFAKLPRCLVGIEACSNSHHWARELIALGHDVRLMPAQYAKPYVKRGKNDAADAEAICEAVSALWLKKTRKVPLQPRKFLDFCWYQVNFLENNISISGG